MKRNCPNCGAPYDTELNTCPYCNTSYFDMSCIDFEECKPVYLKLKTKMGNNTVYITQKVIPRMGDITISTDTVDITGRYGDVINRVVSNKSMTTNVSFEAVNDYTNNSLCQITMCED